MPRSLVDAEKPQRRENPQTAQLRAMQMLEVRGPRPQKAEVGRLQLLEQLLPDPQRPVEGVHRGPVKVEIRQIDRLKHEKVE